MNRRDIVVAERRCMYVRVMVGRRIDIVEWLVGRRWKNVELWGGCCEVRVVVELRGAELSRMRYGAFCVADRAVFGFVWGNL